MISKTVSWIVQHQDTLLETSQWRNWKRYEFEDIAQREFAYRRAKHPGMQWRIVKETETVTLEVVEPNMVGVEE